jgi:hypothetical protein
MIDLLHQLQEKFPAVDNNLIGERNAHFKRKNVARGKNEFSFLSVYTAKITFLSGLFYRNERSHEKSKRNGTNSVSIFSSHV